jgi:regulator of sigma E protease
MGNFVGSVWWMIVSLGVLVTFHEFGHFWVARRFGVKVLRFSVGFGRPLWMRRGRDGTEYAIAAIPLGGYVKMLDEREGDVAGQDLERAFNRRPVGQRIAIVAAGPFANMLLCIALLWAMFVIGRPDFAPVVGHVEGLAAQAELDRGDTLVAVGDRATPTWSEAALALMTAAMDRRDVAVHVQTATGADAVRTLRLSRLPAGVGEQDAFQDIGLTPRHQLVPPTVGRIEPESPAWGILAEGDRITAVDGTPVQAFEDIGPLVQRVGGRTAMIEVQRDGDRLALEVTPKPRDDEHRGRYWALGIGPAPAPIPAYDAKLQFSPIAAVPERFSGSSPPWTSRSRS